jgi:hypothetical protein
VEHAQVQHQHAEREQVEEDPEVEQWKSGLGNFLLMIADC